MAAPPADRRSYSEISHPAASSANVARQVVQRAEASRATIQGLAEATARIGDVVHLIGNIASQTNLLVGQLVRIADTGTFAVRSC